MASPTQWTWVCVNSRSWWWTGRPGVLQSTGSQSQTRLSDSTEYYRSIQHFCRHDLLGDNKYVVQDITQINECMNEQTRDSSEDFGIEKKTNLQGPTVQHRNYIQQFVITYKGKEYILIYVCVCLNESLCCTPEINDIISQLYFPLAQLVKNLPAMKETRVLSLGWKDPLEKEMATHACILVWRIPWTEKPGGL